MEIGNKIKSLRQEKKVTQEELADFLKVSAQAVSKWETNASTPDISLLPALSIYFGVTIDELFEIPEADQYERIQEMLYRERFISDETFKAAKAFLIEQTEKSDNKIKVYRMLADLYNHRAASFCAEAEDYAKKALAIDSNDSDSWGSYIDATHAYSGDEWRDNHSAVINYCKEILEHEPNNRNALMTLIENLLGDIRMDEVLPFIERFDTIEPRIHKGKMYLGDVALLKGNVEKAKELWNEAVHEHSNRWQAYCDRADRLKKIGFIDEAIKDYEKCFDMQCAPRITDGLLSLTQLHESIGDYKAAINDWERLIEVLREEYHITSGEEIDQPKREIERLKTLI